MSWPLYMHNREWVLTRTETSSRRLWQNQQSSDAVGMLTTTSVSKVGYSDKAAGDVTPRQEIIKLRGHLPLPLISGPSQAKVFRFCSTSSMVSHLYLERCGNLQWWENLHLACWLACHDWESFLIPLELLSWPDDSIDGNTNIPPTLHGTKNSVLSVLPQDVDVD